MTYKYGGEMQAGKETIGAADGDKLVTFPVAFPDANVSVVITLGWEATNKVEELSASQFRAYFNVVAGAESYMYWQAVKY